MKDIVGEVVLEIGDEDIMEKDEVGEVVEELREGEKREEIG